jgi:hypothetical protein
MATFENKTTGVTIDTAKMANQEYDPQDLANQGFTPYTPPLPDTPSNLNLPGITGADTTVNQGTDEIRSNNSILGNLGSMVENFVKESATSPDLAASLANLTAERERINALTNADLQAIDAAGAAAGSAYDPLINEANAAKRAGMPKAVVNAGERGGFMNTQFAGAAALAQTIGGDFVGAGGELERIKSVYDDNISKLRSNKERAIAEAKSAATAAIRTGKKQDFDTAVQLYDLARQSHQDAIDLASKKITAINSYMSNQREQVSSVYDVIKKQQDIIENIPAGQSWSTKDPFTGEDITFEGTGSAKPFFSAAQLTQIMLKLDKGETVTFQDPNTQQDITLTGIISQSPKTTTFVDDRGYAHTVETLTGREIAKSTVPVGKTKSAGTTVNVGTLSELPIYDNTGKQIGYRRVNNKTGKTENVDLNGNPVVSVPSGSTVGTFGGGNPSDDSDEFGWIEE